MNYYQITPDIDVSSGAEDEKDFNANPEPVIDREDSLNNNLDDDDDPNWLMLSKPQQTRKKKRKKSFKDGR